MILKKKSKIFEKYALCKHGGGREIKPVIMHIEIITNK